MNRTNAIVGALCAGIFALTAPAWAQGLSGKWQGTAEPNIGRTSSCDPTLKWTISVANGKLTGGLTFPRGTVPIKADVAPDGTFATSYKNSQGINIDVKGKVGDTFSVNNAFSCGYGGMSLKKK